MAPPQISKSALIIVRNESTRLVDCLASLRVNDELIAFDMHSTDGSAEIARSIADRVILIDQVDVVEKVWPRIIREAQNDWIILIDPDEVFPAGFFPALDSTLANHPSIGLVAIPWKYYFLGKPLNSTSWGREHFKARIFHRERVELTGRLFDGIRVKPGFEKYTFPTSSGYVLKHYWIDSLRQLFSKHWRYVRNDGENRFNKGERFSIQKQWKESFRVLRKDLLDYNGLHDGIRGIFLSCFHSWFIYMCHISLLCYQARLKGKDRETVS